MPMCTMSMIGDFYANKWQNFPIRDHNSGYPLTRPSKPAIVYVDRSPITREEFDILRREVSDMKELLIRAKKYDEDNGEPDCQMEGKMEILRKVATLVGVNLDEVIGK